MIMASKNKINIRHSFREREIVRISAVCERQNNFSATRF